MVHHFIARQYGRACGGRTEQNGRNCKDDPITVWPSWLLGGQGTDEGIGGRTNRRRSIEPDSRDPGYTDCPPDRAQRGDGGGQVEGALVARFVDNDSGND